LIAIDPQQFAQPGRVSPDRSNPHPITKNCPIGREVQPPKTKIRTTYVRETIENRQKSAKIMERPSLAEAKYSAVNPC
jgi:hypothetical protein